MAPGVSGSRPALPRTDVAGEENALTQLSAIAEQRWELIVLSGADKGKRLTLAGPPGTELHVGKAPENDLPLSSTVVSRVHCALVREEDSWIVRDLKSTNGTFIDETRIRESFLRPGATLRIGDVVLKLSTQHAPVTIKPSDASEFESLYGTGLRMREIFAMLERLSPTDATVLISGETGTGKGAVARAIHARSKRASGPFVVVDCGAVAPSLIESELFGHEKGAFTGADQKRAGALELASGGTLFIDELDDFAKHLQPKLLRALEERTFQRVGSSQPQSFNARVIAATKKNLRKLAAQGAFREDLYFRLAVFRIDLPPLRTRKEDLPALVNRFAAAFGRPDAWATLSPADRNQLLGHEWPGNLRELRNTVERAFMLADEGNPESLVWQFEEGGLARRGESDFDYQLQLKDFRDRVLAHFEREYLVRLLARCQGKKSQAAREAGIDRSYFYKLLTKHGLAEESPEEPESESEPEP